MEKETGQRKKESEWKQRQKEIEESESIKGTLALIRART
jgi:hypothetical protein